MEKGASGKGEGDKGVERVRGRRVKRRGKSYDEWEGIE